MSLPRFTAPAWFRHTNIYEVNCRQYSEAGTIRAFQESLPRLKEMGIETLWFMPLTPIAQKNKKGTMGSYYACRDFISIDPEFGTETDFKTLVSVAHEMGFKVIIDWVANHTGWDHEWTITHPEYYLKDEATGDFKMASGMDDIIELDYNYLPMRQAMIDAMAYWIREFDIDGFRCDLAFWVTLDFWLEARTALDQQKSLCWFGEFDALEKPEYMQAFDASYSWSWMHASAAFCKNETSLDHLRNLLLQYAQLPMHHLPVWFTANHDENSWNGTEYEKYGSRALALAVLSFTWKGIPMIYSGQELPNNKRLDFFDKDPIAWNGDYALHQFYKTLIMLHQQFSATSADTAEMSLLNIHKDASVLAWHRKNETAELLVLINMSDETVGFVIDHDQVHGNFTDIFSREITEELKGFHFLIPAGGFRVLVK